MSQGPGGPPPYGGPPQQPFGQPPGKPPGPPQPSPPGPTDSSAPVGPARLLALAAGGLGALIYLLGFFEFGRGLGSAYLLGGGLLTAASVLPKVGRVLLPGAIIVVVGTLDLLQAVTGGSTAAVVIVGLILAILQAAAAVGAYLLDAGLISAPASRPAGGGWGRGQPGYGHQGYGPGPSGYGPGGPGPIGAGPPPPFGQQPGGQPGPGWGPPAQPTEVVPRMPGGGPDSEPGEDTSTNSFAVTSPADRPADKAGVFNDGGGMFTDARPNSEQNHPQPPDGAPAATTVIPIVPPDESDGRTQRTERAPRSDATSVFGDGGMFTESKPGRHTTESSSGDGRHENPPDPERQNRKGVPPSEQTWFMPPDERP